MTPAVSFGARPWRAFLCVAAWCAVVLALPAAETARSFDLAASSAEKSLRLFSAQSGLQLIFPTEVTQGVNTPAVRGMYAPREALSRLLAGTGLVAVHDPATGVVTIQREAVPERPRASGSVAPGAGQGTIEGRVFNATSGNHLNRARIEARGTTLETFSSETGAYRLTQVPAGEVVLVASFAGMPSQTTRVTVAPGAVVNQDFILALAETGAATADGIVKLEAFSVTDRVLTGQAIAMHEQRVAPNIKNVISLDEAGEMGEGNVGEFLKYVPGLSTVYTPSTPQLITLRGMPAYGTQVMIDGVPSSPAGGGRAFDFGVAVTGNVDRLEVTKTPTPDMPANAVGGSINIVTKSGFIRKTPLFTYNTFLTYSEFDGFDGFDPRFRKRAGPDSSGGRMFNGGENYDVQPSFDLSYLKPINDSLAITLAASRSLRTNDWIFLTPTWNRDTGIQTQNQFNHVIQGAGVMMFSGKVDWKPTAGQFLQFSVVHSSRESFTRQNIMRAVLGAGATGGPDFAQGAATGVGDVNQNPNLNTQFRNLDHLVLGYRRQGATWTLQGDLSYSVGGFELKDISEGFFQNVGMTNPNLVVRTSGLSGIYDRRIPVVSAVSRTGAPVDVFDGNNLTINTVQSSPRKIENEAVRASFDARRERLWGTPVDLKVGAVFDRMNKEDRTATRSWSFSPPGGAAARLAGNYDLIADAYSHRWYFEDATGARVRPRWVSAKRMYDLFQANPAWFVLNESAAHINEVNGALDLTEAISAGYVRFDTKLLANRLWLLGGVRYEHTRVEGRGPRNDIAATYRRNPDGSFVIGSNGRLVPITTNALERARLQYTKLGAQSEKSYAGYYPSLNASYTLTDRIIARVAYARTVGRPDHPDIIPRATVSDPDAQTAERIITVANPGLKPWTANNYDVTVEAYNVKRATVAVSAFQKDLTGFFSTRRSAATRDLLEEYGFPDQFLDYDVQTTVNGGSASVKGLELSYRQSFAFLPWWGRGLQFYANLTRLRLSGPNADDFTEFSPQELNWGITYGLRKFLVKVNTARSDPVRRRVFAAATATQPTVYEYRSPLTRTDLSVEYQFTRRFVVYTSIRNLQSAEVRNDRYNSLTPQFVRPGNYQFSPTNFTLGLKGEF